MEIVFKHPIMLLGLLLIPLLVILHYYFFEHNRRKAMKFANFAALKRVTGTTLITKNNEQLFLRVLVVIMLVMAATEPVLYYQGESSLTDYVIAVDASASMVSNDVIPDRLTVAKQSAITFMESLEAQTNVGLISFAGVTFIRAPLTENLQEVRDGLRGIDIELAGGTDISTALVTATNLLIPSERSKAIILITDGSDTAGSFVENSLDTGLEYVKRNHVVVHTIGIGSGLSAPGYIEDLNLKAVYDKEALRKIALDTGGNFYEVKNSAELTTAFIDIKGNKEQSIINFEMDYLFMFLGVLLLFTEWGLLHTKFRAFP